MEETSEISVYEKEMRLNQLNDWKLSYFAGGGGLLGLLILGAATFAGSSFVTAATATAAGTVTLVTTFFVGGVVLGLIAYGGYRYYVKLGDADE